MVNDMNVICRGTTPRCVCRIAENLERYDLFFSIGPALRSAWFTVPQDRMDMEYGENETTAIFTLTQHETLLCKEGKAIAELRAIDGNGDARASNIIEVNIIDIVKDGVIHYV